jgi:hypothetical protein
MDSRFSPRATLGIALFLLVPELMRHVSGSGEPYPAVLLPAGAGKLRFKQGKLPMTHTLIEARRGGVWSEVDRAELLEPLPVHYFGEVVRGNFGLEDGKWRGWNAPAPRPSPEARLETKRWLRARLVRMGFDGHALRVVEQRYLLEMPSGAHQATEQLSEKVYELD